MRAAQQAGACGLSYTPLPNVHVNLMDVLKVSKRTVGGREGCGYTATVIATSSPCRERVPLVDDTEPSVCVSCHMEREMRSVLQPIKSRRVDVFNQSWAF